jgi:hypothetical protein
MGLTEVDPSPVEQTPVELKEGYFPPAKESTPRSLSPRISALGLASHGPAYYRMSVAKGILDSADIRKSPGYRSTPHTPSLSSHPSTLRIRL